MHGVKGVGEQVEQHPAQLLRHHAQGAQRRVEVEAAGYLEVVVLGLQAVVGQTQVLLGHVVEADGLALAGVGVGVLQHALHDAGGPVAVLVDFEQVLAQVGQQLGGEAGIGGGLLVRFLQLVYQLQAHFGEVVHEVERVLHLVRHPGGEGGQGHHLLALHQLGLGGLQLGQRLVEAVALQGNFLVLLVQGAVGTLLQEDVARQQGQQQQQAAQAGQQRVHLLPLPVRFLQL